MLGELGLLWLPAPLVDVSCATARAAARHTVDRKIKIFFIQASEVVSPQVTVEAYSSNQNPVESLTCGGASCTERLVPGQENAPPRMQ